MTVRDLFSVIDTYHPSIFIYSSNDSDVSLIYSKFSNRSVKYTKFKFLDNEIFQIYRVDHLEVSFKIIV